MYPVLLQIGNFRLHSYGVMVAVALLAALVVLYRSLAREGRNPDIAFEAIFAGGIGGIVGARLFYVFSNFEAFISDPAMLIRPEVYGLVWYGAFIGGFAAVMVVIRARKVSVLSILDPGVVGLALGYCFGRIGCFLAGDDYGIPSSLPWAMSFPNGAPPTTVNVHPTQLYESAAGLLIFFLLSRLAKRHPRPGILLSAGIGLLSVERILVEFIRTNPKTVDGFSTAQVMSFVLVAASLVGLVLALGRQPRVDTEPVQPDGDNTPSAGRAV